MIVVLLGGFFAGLVVGIMIMCIVQIIRDDEDA